VEGALGAQETGVKLQSVALDGPFPVKFIIELCTRFVIGVFSTGLIATFSIKILRIRTTVGYDSSLCLLSMKSSPPHCYHHALYNFGRRLPLPGGLYHIIRDSVHVGAAHSERISTIIAPFVLHCRATSLNVDALGMALHPANAHTGDASRRFLRQKVPQVRMVPRPP